jgi:hypothetical protein
MNCQNCKYWKLDEKQCRRFPPIDIRISVFPMTEPFDYCGEYKHIDEHDN